MRSLLSVLALSLLLPLATLAQSQRGSIAGTVMDPNGARVVGATATLTNIGTQEKRTAVSDESGGFLFTLLLPGDYQVEIEQAGFARAVRKAEVHVAETLRLDFALAPQAIVLDGPESLSVNLYQDSPGHRSAITNRQVSGLPLDGRNFYELTLLVPGAVPAAQGSAGSVRGDFALSVNGAREDSNNFLLDGVYNVDPKLNTFSVRPPVDAIEEFQMQTSTYDAAFGRNPGAQVNVALKAGTNYFHGSSYEFFRNARLDARNFFAPAAGSKPAYQRNQFGFTVGGPVVRNRTFFFADYEGTRAREGITRLARVPTAAERRGDFSASLLPPPINPFTQQPFTNGIIPAQFIHPVGQAIASLYPLPNRSDAVQNFVSSPALRDRNDSFDARVDHRFSDSTSMIARYSFGDRDLFEPFSGPSFAQVPGYGVFVPRRSQNAMIGLTHVFSPMLVNDLRFAFNRVAAGVVQEGRGASTNRRVGLPELSSNPRDFGLSLISVTGFTPIGDEGNNPQHSVTNTFQLIDNANWSRAAHMISFGFDYRYTQQNAFRDVQSRGFLQFSNFGQITGNGLADLLIGFPMLTGGARVDNAQHLRTASYNFFVSDSYRVRSSLTLSIGLRFEYNSPPVDAFDRSNVYDVATRSLIRVGTAGVQRSGTAADRNNFAPRIGFAWTVDRSEKTVLRAGYGVYFDQSALAPGEALYFNSPYFDFNLFFSLPGLPLTLSDPFPSQFPYPLPDSALAIQRDLRTPYMQHWSASIQRELGRSRVFELSYVGSKGTKLLTARDINQPAPSTLAFVLRPNPQFDDINIIESRANSNYHSLQARFEQKLSNGLSVLGSYVWSKSIDDASNFFTSAGDPNFPQDSNNVRAERGRSNFDVRHRLSVSYGYDLPFGRGKQFASGGGLATAILAGWQTFGVVTLQTGRPFTVALLGDIDNSNTGRSTLGFGANDRPNVSGNPALQIRTVERWFNTAAFAFSPRGTFGNAGRNTLDGPGFRNVNLSLVKNTALTESVNLQFRAEFFNAFNHPNFNLPDNFLGLPSFGRIISAQSPRRVQFGVKVEF